MTSAPEKIGKYEVLDIAGRGAMGVVYVGHDPFINRRVAIKVCSSGEKAEQAMTDPRARRLFFNEAQAAGTLDHPNILRVYDAGDADGQPYIVMEYVEGGRTLKSNCEAGRLLPIPKVLALTHQCAKALDYAHRRGVLHRDIKPANIMITEDGEPKIGDFGIAQQLHTETTQIMTAVGSPRYMSPEQAGDEELTGQTDIYSLGVTMYELLTGRTPHEANSLAALMLAITSKDPTPVRDVRPQVSEEVACIVHKAMARTRAERYQTGAEMAEDLAHLMDELERPPIRELSLEEQFERARGLAFFNDFSDKELEEVLEVADWTHFAPSEALIVEGTTDHAFYVIASGDASVTVEGKEVAVIDKGECVGEIGYLAPVKRSASVLARSDVSAIKVDAALMEWASIPVQLRFNRAFQQTLIDRLSRTTRELAQRLD